MDRIKIIFIYVSVSLSFEIVRGQQIGNYISNGSFELLRDCNWPNALYAKDWIGIDSTCFHGFALSKCNGRVPSFNTIYQHPRTGQSYLYPILYYPGPWTAQITYSKNRLKSTLEAGKTYCVKFYVNVSNTSTHGIDGFGAYFCDDFIDTITYCNIPLSFLSPQIQNPKGNIITDTLNWVPVSGTFVATGTEKFLLLGNFLANNAVSTATIRPDSNITFTEVGIDDVSCIEINLSAYAGPDKLILPTDSAYIGRQLDFAIDRNCIWYKLPNMTIPIDTISGLWVKPTATSTYVVRQELDCSSLKWDTVVVTINTNLDGLNSLQKFADNITLAPNPTSGLLKISYSGATEFRPTCFSIYNSFGQNIRDEVLHDMPVDIQTSDLGPGLYEILFKTRYGTLTKKFVRTN